MTISRFVSRCCSRHYSRHHGAAILAAALLALSGCDKSSDLPRLQDDATATAARYQERIDELNRRVQALGQRAAQVPRDAFDTANAARLYQKARANLDRSRAELRQVPKQIQDAAKAGGVADLRKLNATMRDRLDAALQEAVSSLDAVESWLAVSAQRKSPPPAPTARADVHGDPDPDPDPGHGAAAGR